MVSLALTATQKPSLSSSQPTPDLTQPGLQALCMLVGCFTIDLYVGAQPDLTSLIIGYPSLSAHLVCRGFHQTNQQTEPNGGSQMSVALTGTGLSLIPSLASFLSPVILLSIALQKNHINPPSHPASQFSQSAPSTLGQLGSWVAALTIYSVINHLSLTEPSKSTRAPDPGSDDVLSLMIIRMLSGELAGTVALDHPMGNMPDRLVGLVSYLGQCRNFCTAVHPAFHITLETAQDTYSCASHRAALFFWMSERSRTRIFRKKCPADGASDFFLKAGADTPFVTDPLHCQFKNEKGWKQFNSTPPSLQCHCTPWKHGIWTGTKTVRPVIGDTMRYAAWRYC